jgi:hypothetical protein
MEEERNDGQIPRCARNDKRRPVFPAKKRQKKASRFRKAISSNVAGNYISTVLDLSLQQDFSDLAVLVQQDFPLAHFFFFLPFPPSAKEAPVKSKAAVANNNTFFIVIILCD